MDRLYNLDYELFYTLIGGSIRQSMMNAGQRPNTEDIEQFANVLLDRLCSESILKVIVYLRNLSIKFYGGYSINDVVSGYLNNTYIDNQIVTRDGKVM